MWVSPSAAAHRRQDEAIEHPVGLVVDGRRRRLDALFATMQDEVYMTDADGIIDGLARPPPGVPAEAVLGTVMLDWSAPEERGPMEARYNQVRESGAIVAYETAARFPDGSIQYMSSRMGSIRDGDRHAGNVPRPPSGRAAERPSGRAEDGSRIRRGTLPPKWRRTWWMDDQDLRQFAVGREDCGA